MDFITDRKIELILFFQIFLVYTLILDSTFNIWNVSRMSRYASPTPWSWERQKKKKKTFLNIVCIYMSIWNIKRLVTPFKGASLIWISWKKKEFATTLKGYVTFETLTHMYLLCCVKILIHICMDYGQFNNYVHV